jgi:hypothetical protein
MKIQGKNYKEGMNMKVKPRVPEGGAIEDTEQYPWKSTVPL